MNDRAIVSIAGEELSIALLLRTLQLRCSAPRSAPASPPDVRRGSAPPPINIIKGWAMPAVRASPLRLWAKPEPGAQPKIKWISYGGAEPRLTSGGEAGADGVKFMIGPRFSGRYLTSGGEAGADGVKFMIGPRFSGRYLTSGEAAA